LADRFGLKIGRPQCTSKLILIISNPPPSIFFRSPTRYAGAIPNWRKTPHSNTPSFRVAGFEDDDEDENEAPCEGRA